MYDELLFTIVQIFDIDHIMLYALLESENSVTLINVKHTFN
jgi:hypothetical protein